jgi:hypothetical protein
MRGILVLLTALMGTAAARAYDPISPAPIPPLLATPPAYILPPGWVEYELAPPPSHFHEWLAYHRREPNGIPTPVGAGNGWTEFKYVFGSSRAFFGTADSSVGVWSHATVPPPYRDR